MDLTIIGTGNMARALATRALAGGHGVTVVGKDEEHAQEAASAVEGSISTALTGDPIEGDVVVLAVYYPDARDAVEQYADQLAGKPVVDITNPVNDTFDGLVVPPDGSATQELAALAPEARFVKAFNTTFARTLAPGEVSGHAIDVLSAGDDEKAKDAVATFARDGGLNPIDAGPLRRARELEAAGLLHMTLQDKLGTGFGSALKFIA
jgi:8-hydroxy-5-deazaflavin:NADPH oxidoreductase